MRARHRRTYSRIEHSRNKTLAKLTRNRRQNQEIRHNKKVVQTNYIQALEEVNRIHGIVEAGNSLAEQITQELEKQIAQLDRMYDILKDTQSYLKRSAKYISYFVKQVYTDKLLMCLIGFIFLAIVVLVILSAMGLEEGKFKTPDQVKESATRL